MDSLASCGFPASYLRQLLGWRVFAVSVGGGAAGRRVQIGMCGLDAFGGRTLPFSWIGGLDAFSLDVWPGKPWRSRRGRRVRLWGLITSEETGDDELGVARLIDGYGYE